MPPTVHLCGSVPLDSAETVFSTCASIFGSRAPRLPDGEIGKRRYWIAWQLDILLNHSDLEISTSAQKKDDYLPVQKLRSRVAVDPNKIFFDELGYAKAAKESWTVFQKLTVEGKINSETRFQVSLPTTIAVIGVFVAEHQEKIERCYETKLLSAINEILEFIPNNKLAIQFDVCMELAYLENVYPSWFGDTYEDQLSYIVERLARLGNAVPKDVQFGMHLCYGDYDHRHFAEPTDMTKMTDIIKSVMGLLHRPLTYVHMAVPRSRDDAAYFAPLQSIVSLFTPHQVQLFLGLVHFTDGEEGAKKRIDTAAKVIKGFGVSTECGLGRRPEKQIIKLLDLMRAVSDMVPQ